MGFKTPLATLEAISGAGVKKSQHPWPKLLLQGFYAGAYIAFGGALAWQVGGGYTGDIGIKKFLYGAVFPVGLMAVVFTGAELFTGNTMCLIIPVLQGKISYKGLLYNWGVSYLGNFIGSVFFGLFLCYLPGLYSDDLWLASVKAVAKSKIDLGFGKVLLRGIGCNWLVCLAVWQAIASDDIISKIWGIWWPIMAFVALGYEHCVANMFFVPTGLMYGAYDDHGGAGLGFGKWIYNNLIPATIGNILGGAVFMGALYWYLLAPKEVPAPAPAAKEEPKESVPLDDKV